VKFYVDHFAQVQYLPTIPVALLDLSSVQALASPVSGLVAKLAGLSSNERMALIEPARLFELDLTNPYHPILLAGDGALIDVLKLCTVLKSVAWPAAGPAPAQAAAQQAVADVETGLIQLVSMNKEAHPAAASDLGFQGVSAFYWPPFIVDTDDFITEAVRRSVSAYKGLEFVKQTGWDQLGLENKL